MKWPQILHKVETFFTPGRILGVAVVSGLLFGLLFELFSCDMYRDVAGCYAWYAREFSRGLWNAVPLSKLPPLNIFLAGLIARLGIEPYRALIGVAVVFSVLTIAPLYHLLKLYLSPRAAAWGGLLFIYTPKLIRFSGMGLLESSRDFFLVTAVWLLLRSYRTRFKWFSALGLGAALGGLALARGEGIVMAGLIGLAMIIRPRADYGSFKLIVQRIVLPMVLAIVAALAVLSPRLVQNYRLTGYPVIDTRAIGVLQLLPGSDQIFQDRRPAPPQVSADPEPEVEFEDTIPGRLIELPRQILRGGYELYMLLAIIGIVGLCRRREWRAEYTFLVIYPLVVALTFLPFAVAYRYFIYFVPLWMGFTLYGVADIFRLLERKKWRDYGVALLAVAVVAQPFNALSKLIKREGAENIRLAQYIVRHKAQLLPPARAGEPLVIYDVMCRAVNYHCDQRRLADYGQKVDGLSKLRGFDVLVIESKKTDQIELLQKRRDLAEFPSPDPDFKLFVPVR